MTVVAPADVDRALTERRAAVEAAERARITAELQQAAEAEALAARTRATLDAAAWAGIEAYAAAAELAGRVAERLADLAELVAQMKPHHRAIIRAFDMTVWAAGQGLTAEFNHGSKVPISSDQVTAAFKVAIDLARLGGVDTQFVQQRAAQQKGVVK